MSDYEKLTTKSGKTKAKEQFDEIDNKLKVGDRDDLSGMALNILKHN